MSVNVDATNVSAGSSLPQDTCPLCRQPALDRNNDLWICDFCGCEIDFDVSTRRARVSYFPPQYSPLSEVIGSDWLTRRELFARADAAQARLTPSVEDVAERSRFGPLIIIALALLVACVMLGAVASALVISPSIARTRRTIAELYRPTPTITFTPEPTVTATTSQGVQSPLSVTPAVSLTTGADITATPTLIATATAPQLPPTQPAQPPINPPTVAPTRAVATQAPPPLPPTFTPIVPPTLAPTVQVTATATVTPATATATINPLASPLTPTATATLATQGGGTTPTPTASPTVQAGAVSFQGQNVVQVSNIKFLGTEANEADEYVEIRNIGTQPINLDGWSLKAIQASDGQIIDQYLFGNGFVLAVGQVCHIYTAKLSTGDNCGTGTGFDHSTPIWPNTSGAHASLFNQANIEQARFSY